MHEAKKHVVEFYPIMAILHKKGGLLKSNLYRQCKISDDKIIQTEGKTKDKVTETKGKEILVDYKASANIALKWANDKRVAFMNFRVMIIDPNGKITARVSFNSQPFLNCKFGLR